MASSNKEFKASEQVAAVYSSSQNELAIFGRAPTNIGKQGDHVSAYTLIESLAISSLSEYGFKATIKRFYSYFSDLASYMEYKINEQNELVTNYHQAHAKQMYEKAERIVENLKKNKQELDSILNNAKINLDSLTQQDNEDIQNKTKILNKLNQDENLLRKAIEEKWKLATDLRYKVAIEELINIYLTMRNKMPNTAFPRQGNIEPLSNEGAIIKLSCKELAAINHALNPLEKKDAPQELEEAKINQIAQLMLNMFWFPKIPADTLIDLNTDAGKKHWSNIVKRKKYKKNTRPRDNSHEALIDVCINHIDLIIKCFPSCFNNEDSAKKIINKFIALVAQTGVIQDTAEEKKSDRIVGWNMSKKEHESLQQAIDENVLYLRILDPESRHPSEDNSAESSRRSSNESKSSTASIVGSLNASISSSGNDSDFDPELHPATEAVTIKNSPYLTRGKSQSHNEDKSEISDNRQIHGYKKQR